MSAHLARIPGRSKAKDSGQDGNVRNGAWGAPTSREVRWAWRPDRGGLIAWGIVYVCGILTMVAAAVFAFLIATNP